MRFNFLRFLPSLCLSVLFGLTGLGETTAQRCEGMKEATKTIGQEIVVVKSIKMEKRADVQTLRENLTRQLQLEMSGFISTVVKEEIKYGVEEKKGQFTDYFYSDTQMETFVRLGYASVDFCEDKDLKLLWGTYALHRADLAAAISKECNLKLAALNSEIVGKVYSQNKIDVQPIQQVYQSCVNDHSTAVFLDHKVDVGNWEELLHAYNVKMGELSNSQDQVAFNRDFNAAKDQVKKGNYFEGIQQLKTLRIDYYDNQELNKTLDVALVSFKEYVERTAAASSDRGEYKVALELLGNYANVESLDAGMKRLKEDISKAFFYSEVEKFRKAVKYEEEKLIHSHKKNIDALSDVSASVYREINEEYDDYNRRIGMKKAIAEKNKRNYWESYRQIQELETRFGKRDGELISLKTKVKNKLLQSAYSDERLKRQNTWSFWLGADVFSNAIAPDRVSRFTLSDFMFSYSVGLYRKYRFEEANARKFYPVQSDFIGVKLRLFDYLSRQNLAVSDTLLQWIGPTDRVSYELGIDGISWRVVHYGLGLGLPSSFAIRSPLYYSFTLGFRIPIGALSWTTDAHLQSALQGKGLLLFSSGLQWRFDFNRKFGRADKRKIAAELFG